MIEDVVYNFPDISSYLNYIKNFTPLQFVISIVFYIIAISLVADTVIHVFYKIFNFCETAFNNAEEIKFFKKVLERWF